MTNQVPGRPELKGVRTMFGLGTQELVIILVIAFFVFGAKKLPEIGRDLGKGIRSFKKGLNDIQEEGKEIITEGKEQGASTVNKTMDQIPGVKEVREVKETIDQLKV